MSTSPHISKRDSVPRQKRPTKEAKETYKKRIYLVDVIPRHTLATLQHISVYPL
jgi:hypothetical protein